MSGAIFGNLDGGASPVAGIEASTVPDSVPGEDAQGGEDHDKCDDAVCVHVLSIAQDPDIVCPGLVFT